MRRLLGLLGVALASSALFSACGGSDDSTPSAAKGPDLTFWDWERSLIPGPQNLPDGAGFRSRDQAEAAAAAAGGALVIEDPGPVPAALPWYYVIRGQPALSASDIQHAEATSFPTEKHQAALSIEFTDAGKKKLAALTKAVAERRGHFAVIYSGTLLSLPIVDPQGNPDGISGEQGVLIGGHLTASEAEKLATSLNGG